MQRSSVCDSKDINSLVFNGHFSFSDRKILFFRAARCNFLNKAKIQRKTFVWSFKTCLRITSTWHEEENFKKVQSNAYFKLWWLEEKISNSSSFWFRLARRKKKSHLFLKIMSQDWYNFFKAMILRINHKCRIQNWYWKMLKIKNLMLLLIKILDQKIFRKGELGKRFF